jgi:tellurite resistance protein
MSKKNIFKAMGSLAYAIAVADGEIQPEEKSTIKKLVLNEFDLTDIDNAWITNMFNELENRKITLEDAYQYALDTLESNRYAFDFDEEMKRKCIRFIEKTADSFDGIDNNERQVIKRLKMDLTKF